jgi:hypothetical protein
LSFQVEQRYFHDLPRMNAGGGENAPTPRGS